MNDEQFLAALEDGSLPPDQFSHRSHLRAAWLYLERHALAEAARRCALTIQRYATGLGVPEKFHLTLSLAFMHIVAEQKQQHPARDWEAFLAACPDLQTNAQAIIGRYYSEAVLDSPQARRSFVPPDRAPLPTG